MERSILHIKQSRRRSYNHNNNQVSYSLDTKTFAKDSVNMSRYTINIINQNKGSNANSRYLRICKSLQKIKDKEKQNESLSTKIEERMKIRRAMELEKLFQDNTKMFARIYTQKSEYSSYGRNCGLVKKRKVGNKSMKENKYEIQESTKEDKIHRESKIMKMRMACGLKKTVALPGLNLRVNSYIRESISKRAKTEGICMI